MAAVISQYPDFDELVTLQGEIDFTEYGASEAGFADHDDRMQMVRTCSQGAPLRGCEWLHVRKS